MAKTFNKRPTTFDVVDSDDLDYAYQNMSSPSGINESKNFVNVDQNSFAEAENVYIDEDNLLSSRPGLKEKEQTTMEAAVISADTTIVDVFNVNGILFYHLKSNDGTYSVWSELTSEHSCGESLKITYMGNRYVFFTTNDIFAWNVNKSDSDPWEKIEELQYIPTIVTGATTTESENVFVNGFINKVLGTSITNWSDYDGDSIIVTINDENYSLTFVTNQEELFVSAVSNRILYHVQANGTVLIGENDNTIYYYYGVSTDTSILFQALSTDYAYQYNGNPILSETADSFVWLLLGTIDDLVVAYYQIGTSSAWTYMLDSDETDAVIVHGSADMLSDNIELGHATINKNYLSRLGANRDFYRLSGTIPYGRASSNKPNTISSVGASGYAKSKDYVVFLMPLTDYTMKLIATAIVPASADTYTQTISDSSFTFFNKYCEQCDDASGTDHSYSHSFNLMDSNCYLFVFVNVSTRKISATITSAKSFCNFDDIYNQSSKTFANIAAAYSYYNNFAYYPKISSVEINEDGNSANILYITYAVSKYQPILFTTISWGQVILTTTFNNENAPCFVLANRPGIYDISTEDTGFSNRYSYNCISYIRNADATKFIPIAIRFPYDSSTLSYEWVMSYFYSSATINDDEITYNYPLPIYFGNTYSTLSELLSAGTYSELFSNKQFGWLVRQVDKTFELQKVTSNGSTSFGYFVIYYNFGFIVDGQSVTSMSATETIAKHFNNYMLITAPYLAQNTLDVTTYIRNSSEDISIDNIQNINDYRLSTKSYTGAITTTTLASTITTNTVSSTSSDSDQGTLSFSFTAAELRANRDYSTNKSAPDIAIIKYSISDTTSVLYIDDLPAIPSYVNASYAKVNGLTASSRNSSYRWIVRNYESTNQLTIKNILQKTGEEIDGAILFRIISDVPNIILTSKYYYRNKQWINTIYDTLIPISLTQFVSIYPSLIFQSSDHTKLYRYIADNIMITNTKTISYNILFPDHSLQFTNDFLSFGNKLYYRTKTEDGRIYFAKDSEVLFPSNITNMIQLSETSVAIFLATEVYIMTYQGIDETTGVVDYTCTKSKLQLGCREGDDVMLIYDGSTILLPTLKGLTSLTYDKLVLNTEQVYSYLSDNLSDLYKELIDGNILLQQYKQYIIVYSPVKNYCYIYDLNNSSWWKWKCSKKIDKILYANESLLIFMDNKLYTFNDETDRYYDFGSEDIEWHFKSQKLHFSAPNNYKHVYNMMIETSSDDNKDVRYKLTLTNYRKSKNEEDGQIFEYSIDGVSHFVKRCNYYKTAAFQYELSSVYNEEPKQFKLSNIAIKYRITDGIR